MNSPFPHAFERYCRTTVPQDFANDPSALYDLCTFTSKTALGLAYHYSGKHISTVLPLWDDGSQSEYGNPILKTVSTGNVKPVVEEKEDDRYTRVCSEQNAIDNGLMVGDLLVGFGFIRSEKALEQYEGNKKTEAPHLCRPCRVRALPVFGGNMVIVSFVGDSDIPIEASTIRQQIEHHDFGEPLEGVARGREVKEYIVEEVFRQKKHMRRVESLPFIPSRKYQRNIS